GRAARSSAGVKTRMPLPKLIVVFDANDRDRGALESAGELAEVVKDELNVKAIEVREQAEGLVREVVKPDLKVLGPKLGKGRPRGPRPCVEGRAQRGTGRAGDRKGLSPRRNAPRAKALAPARFSGPEVRHGAPRDGRAALE